jgi:hypothetical protein
MDMKKKIISSCMVGLLGLGVTFGAAPAPRAEASGVLADVLGTAIMGTVYRDKVMGVYKTYNNTDKRTPGMVPADEETGRRGYG